MENQDIVNILSESISKPLAKAIETVMLLGLSKHEALDLLTRMVDFAYSNNDVRKQMLDEADEIIKMAKEENNV